VAVAGRQKKHKGRTGALAAATPPRLIPAAKLTDAKIGFFFSARAARFGSGRGTGLWGCILVGGSAGQKGIPSRDFPPPPPGPTPPHVVIQEKARIKPGHRSSSYQRLMAIAASKLLQ